jgi:hypothetical protein
LLKKFRDFLVETVPIYLAHLDRFIKTYSEDYPQYKICIDYILDTWIKPNSAKPLAEHFVYAFNHDHFNMGQSATSRCESAHSALKKYIIKRESLPKTLPKLETYLNTLMDRIDKEETADASKVKQKMKNHDIFADVVGRISGFAMDQMYNQFAMYEASVFKDKHKQLPLPEICSGGYRSTLGLPCCHDIKSILEGGLTSKRIEICKIHKQYLLPRASVDVGSSFQSIYEPLTGKKKNSAANASSSSQNKRIKSGFEKVFIITINTTAILY